MSGYHSCSAFSLRRLLSAWVYIGVDLFFVISGLLIGGLLTEEFLREGKINYFKFILRRGFKIWPSYYFFLLVGNGIAVFLYRNTHPDQIIPLSDIKRYLLFYQNYTGSPFSLQLRSRLVSLCGRTFLYHTTPLVYNYSVLHQTKSSTNLSFDLCLYSID